MQKLLRNVLLGMVLQASAFALAAEVDISVQQGAEITELGECETTEAGIILTKRRNRSSSHEDECRFPRGYASFFLTSGSSGTGLAAGENLIFNNQVTLSGIDYDTSTGVFTLGPGTYSVIYLFFALEMPPINMYVNGQLVLNSPLGGGSTVLTLTDPINTLTLQAIAAGTFSAPSAGQSVASIAIFQID